MEISALTRSVVKRGSHALISPDGYINSTVPGWTGCTVNVILNEQMGAGLCQTLIHFQQGGGVLNGRTEVSQIFFYVVSGKCQGEVSGESQAMEQGHFVYIPIGREYRLEATGGSQVLSFHKVYEKLEGVAIPGTMFGDAGLVSGKEYLGDPALRLQVLLPENFSFDMAVNIFTYDPGGHLPMVETHIMEHGLLYLQGQGIYMLDQQWYPVKKGDSIWMAPYCQQWFTAMGKEPAVYIYYKNVNRHPTTI